MVILSNSIYGLRYNQVFDEGSLNKFFFLIIVFEFFLQSTLIILKKLNYGTELFFLRLLTTGSNSKSKENIIKIQLVIVVRLETIFEDS